MTFPTDGRETDLPNDQEPTLSQPRAAEGRPDFAPPGPNEPTVAQPMGAYPPAPASPSADPLAVGPTAVPEPTAVLPESTAVLPESTAVLPEVTRQLPVPPLDQTRPLPSFAPADGPTASAGWTQPAAVPAEPVTTSPWAVASPGSVAADPQAVAGLQFPAPNQADRVAPAADLFRPSQDSGPMAPTGPAVAPAPPANSAAPAASIAGPAAFGPNQSGPLFGPAGSQGTPGQGPVGSQPPQNYPQFYAQGPTGSPQPGYPAAPGHPAEQPYQTPAPVAGYPPAGYQAVGAGYPPASHAAGGPQQPPGTPGYPYGPNPYAQPPLPTKTKRWPLVLTALLLAVTLIGATFWAGRVTQVAPQPTITQPAEEPLPSEYEQPSTQTQTKSHPVTAAESVGVVLIKSALDSGIGAGTGMILSADGKVLTNYHVVAGSTEVTVSVADTGDSYSAEVVGFDASRDVALLQLKGASGLKTVTVDQVIPQLGSEVAAVGNAGGGGELIKAPGQVTAVDQDLTVNSESPWGNTEDLTGLIQTDAGAVPGDSGGPMFDAEAEVIGMTTAGSTDEGTSYAVPIADALAVVEQIETGQDSGTTRVGPAAFLGVVAATEQEAGRGRTITQVVEGGPADKAGMVDGSRITKIDDVEVESDTNLATVIRGYEPGAEVSLEWITPKGKTKTGTATLEESSAN